MELWIGKSDLHFGLQELGLYSKYIFANTINYNFSNTNRAKAHSSEGVMSNWVLLAFYLILGQESFANRRRPLFAQCWTWPAGASLNLLDAHFGLVTLAACFNCKPLFPLLLLPSAARAALRNLTFHRVPPVRKGITFCSIGCLGDVGKFWLE